MADDQMPVGQWVQLNPKTQSKRAKKPTPIEQTIGMVRSAYTAQGTPMYQVVWNPGSVQPSTALYRHDQLTPIDTDKANEIAGEMNAGNYTPNLGEPGSEHQEPNVPTQALPPTLQQAGATVQPSTQDPNTYNTSVPS